MFGWVYALGVMKFHCPNCNQRIEAEDLFAGKTVECPACSVPFTVPFPEKKIPPTPPPTRVLPPEKEDADWCLWNPISAWHKLPHSAGIYEIKNSASGMSYVGSAKSLKKRGHHKSLSAGSSHSDAMQQAFNSDGEESFQFRVLEFCDKAKLFEREQKHIDERDFNTLYNAAPRAGTVHGYVLTPEQTVERTKRRKENPLSDEVLANMKRKRVEREFKTNLYDKLFKDFKKTGEYKSLAKEIKDYADAAPNRYEIIMDHDRDGNEYPIGNSFFEWWEWGGGCEYMEKKFEFSKCDWEYVQRDVARMNKEHLTGRGGCSGSESCSLIAESLFHRDVEQKIEDAFQEAVKTGEVSLEYKTSAQRQEEQDRYMDETMKELEASIKILRRHQGKGLWWVWNYLCKLLALLRNIFVKKQEKQVISGPVPCEGWIKIGDCKAHYLTHREDDCYKSLCGREKWRYQDYQNKFCYGEPNIEDRCKTCEKNRLKRIK